MSPDPTPNLSGRRIVVTGTSRGLGASAAAGLAARGAELGLLCRQVDGGPDPRALELRDQIRARGGRAEAFSADLAEPGEIESAFAAIERELGPVDVLVNNAALSRVEAWDATNVEDWDRVMAVNVRAAWLCARAVAPAMTAAGWGRILNLTSIEVRMGGGGALAYVTSKAALIGLTRGLAEALGGAGIGVNAVMPGAIRSPLEAEAYGESDEHDDFWIERQCVPRRGLPEDVTELIAFLASPASDFISGQVIAVDGGATFG